jgi:hypothetical protein
MGFGSSAPSLQGGGLGVEPVDALEQVSSPVKF